MDIERLITTCVELGSARAMQAMGLHSGEISTREAKKVYGTYFVDAVSEGRIRPCRIGEGSNGTKWYRITDILSLQAQDYAKVELL